MGEIKDRARRLYAFRKKSWDFLLESIFLDSFHQLIHGAPMSTFKSSSWPLCSTSQSFLLPCVALVPPMPQEPSGTRLLFPTIGRTDDNCQTSSRVLSFSCVWFFILTKTICGFSTCGRTVSIMTVSQISELIGNLAILFFFHLCNVSWVLTYHSYMSRNHVMTIAILEPIRLRLLV